MNVKVTRIKYKAGATQYCEVCGEYKGSEKVITYAPRLADVKGISVCRKCIEIGTQAAEKYDSGVTVRVDSEDIDFTQKKFAFEQKIGYIKKTFVSR